MYTIAVDFSQATSCSDVNVKLKLNCIFSASWLVDISGTLIFMGFVSGSQCYIVPNPFCSGTYGHPEDLFVAVP